MTTGVRLGRAELIQRLFALRPAMHRRFNEEMTRELHDELHDVTIHQLSVLEHLRHGPLAMRELARALGVGESSATATADRLVRQGLVERLADPGDRRLVLLSLTGEGSALVDGVERAAARRTSRMLSALSDEQLAQLVDILETLRDAPSAPFDDTTEHDGARR
ncbi:MAG TPA: MarR family transcriptional regulator [Acidimicrobiales bacterium]|nr:MarR family transcriptional regulator [Acidimicrobiales bacterium]